MSTHQIHAEVDESPLDSFSFVLFLLLDEHVVVEELLETLVGVVDAELLEGVEVENFETGNIEHTAEEAAWEVGTEGTVDDLDQVVEETAESGLGDGGQGVVALVDSLTLGDPLVTDLDLWRAHGLEPLLGLDTEEEAKFVGGVSSVWLSLLFTGLLLEGDVSGVHDTGSDLPDGVLLVLVEAENVEGLVGGVQLLVIINRLDLDLTHGAELVVVWVLGDHAHLVDLGLVAGTDLVEDVETTLGLELEGDTGLLEQIGVDITRGEFTSGLEVNTDEFTEARGVIVTDGLGVTVGLHTGVGSDDLILKGTTTAELGGVSTTLTAGSGDNGEVLDNTLGVDSFTGTRLTSNQHRLVLAVAQHIVVGVVRDGVDVGRHLSLTLVLVAHDDVVVVDGKPLVGVDGDTEETRVGVDQEELVARLQVVDNRCLKVFVSISLV